MRGKLLTGWIPRAQNYPAIGGVFPNFSNDLRELIDTLVPVRALAISVPGAKVSPLKAVNWTQVTLSAIDQAAFSEKVKGAVPIPYFHAIRGKELGVC